MNFFAHYCLQNTGDAPYDFGLLVPDMLQLARYPSALLHVRERMRSESSDSRLYACMEGMCAHYAADAAFHRSALFSEGLSRIKSCASDRGIRMSPLASHVLFELLLDHFLLTQHQADIDDMYAELSDVSVVTLADGICSVIGSPSDSLRSFFRRFMDRRYVRELADIVGVLDTLQRICANFDAVPFTGNAEFISAAYLCTGECLRGIPDELSRAGFGRSV